MFSPNSEAFNYNYNTSSYILYGCHVTYKNVNSYPFHIACLSDIIKQGDQTAVRRILYVFIL